MFRGWDAIGTDGLQVRYRCCFLTLAAGPLFLRRDELSIRGGADMTSG